MNKIQISTIGGLGIRRGNFTDSANSRSNEKIEIFKSGINANRSTGRQCDANNRTSGSRHGKINCARRGVLKVKGSAGAENNILAHKQIFMDSQKISICKTTKLFFPARVIARAAGVNTKSVLRRARRENWPSDGRAYRAEFTPPRGLLRRCVKLCPQQRVFHQPATIRALLRASAVCVFCFSVQRNPRRSIERILREVASDFRHLKKFSTTTLRHWISAVERGGLAALCERKIGIVGRKPARLERILR